ncbi:MAG: hypothetical protein QNJ07_01680 [Woeseiaceae bacterium]|nr:hypothetical protein [Woeseiaceae bacterium]
MNNRRAFVVAALLSFALPAMADSKDDAFFTSKRDFKKQYRTIALSPIDADAVFNMPESVAAIIEQEVTNHLQKRGITVIPSSVLGGIRRTMEEQVGGVTDPESGATDMAKLRAVRTHAFRELWYRHDIDAVATIRLSVTSAQFEKDRAEWDGVKQKVEHEGRDKGYSGKIAVSSIGFAVFDHSDRIRYQYYGGLEVLQKRIDARLEPIPAERFFSDEKRIRKAAQIAVSPI